MADPNELIAYYQDLLIAEYATKPRAVATIGALMGGTGDTGLIANAIYNQVRDGFDLATAAGQQLDALGQLRGVARYFVSLDLSKVFLALPRYDAPGVGTLPGLATYDDLPMPPTIYTMTYNDFAQNTLTDGDFRRVIEFLAAVHSCDFAYGTLDKILLHFFNNNVNLKITGNMAVTYQHLTSDTDNLFEIVNQMNLLPVPAGVTRSVAEVASF